MAHRLIAYVTKCGFVLHLVLIACFACPGIDGAKAQDQAGQAAPEASSRPENSAAAVDCRELATLIQQQKSIISKETGQLKREIAALREELSRPGIKEIFAGIGYILGLVGIWLYAHNRGTDRNQE
jgi:hypothetical protein